MKPYNRELTQDDLDAFSQSYQDNPVLQATGRAVARVGLPGASFRNEALRDIRHLFSLDIKTMAVSNQKATGRCWLFAALNLLRENIAAQYNLEEFELSHNYMAFWDKYEKINYFLDVVLQTLDEPTDGRLVTWLTGSFQDGGQWDMFVNLVRKYGVVPKQAMPETFNSEATGHLNYVINTMLRKSAAELRRLHRDGASAEDLDGRRREIVSALYGTLCQCFGEPPRTFTWEFSDKDRNFSRFNDLTPLDFYRRFVTLPLEDMVSIIHAPTQDKPFGKTFTVRFINNVVGGKPILYLNLDMPDLKALVLRQMQAGEIVWFGSDVGHFGDRDLGAWFNDLYDYKGVLGLDLAMSKEDRLDYRQSAMNHAMVLTGVNLEDDKPNRWRIENSWGEERGKKGYYVADNLWFDDYVYQAVIDRKYLSAEQLAALEQKPIELEPWDPMGTLAD